MAFKGGDHNINRAGKKPGTLNGSTKMMKEAFAMLVENNLPNMTVWIEQIAQQDPAKAMDLIIKLSERFVPALARTEVTGIDGEDLFKNVQFQFGPPIDSNERVQEETNE